MSALFDDLKEKALRVCLNATRLPTQWIYAVDDAWLHDTQSPDKAVFSNEGKHAINRNPLAPDEALKRMRKATPSVIGKATGSPELEASPKSIARLQDSEVAKALIAFVQQNPSYGLCFCSFEFFLKHITEINRPQNAVFFDLRHLLAESNQTLKADWAREVETWGLFRDSDSDRMDRLGWYLYFAFKLGRLPGAETCKIDFNHLLILSSAIFGDGRERESVLQAFLNVQQQLWAQLESVADTIKPTGLSLTFIPMPKSSDVIFTTGLNIFNKTFSQSETFEEKKSGLIHDTYVLWSGDGHEWAHVDENHLHTIRGYKLMCCRILPHLLDGTGQRYAPDTLRAFFRPKREKPLRVAHFLALLQHLAPGSGRSTITYIRSPSVGLDTAFFPGIAPGIFLVIGLAEFLNALNKGPIDLELRSSNGSVLVDIKIHDIPEGGGGVAGFIRKRIEDGCKASGAAGALCRLLAGTPTLFDDVLCLDADQLLGNASAALADDSNGGMQGGLKWSFLEHQITLSIGDIVL